MQFEIALVTPLPPVGATIVDGVTRVVTGPEFERHTLATVFGSKFFDTHLTKLHCCRERPEQMGGSNLKRVYFIFMLPMHSMAWFMPIASSPWHVM